MVKFRNLSVAEIKKEFAGRHGFVFNASAPSSDAAIARLCDLLIQKGITTEYPECVIRLGQLAVAFVYNTFDGPAFFSSANTPMMMGVCQINSLHEFLQNN